MNTFQAHHNKNFFLLLLGILLVLFASFIWQKASESDLANSNVDYPVFEDKEKHKGAHVFRLQDTSDFLSDNSFNLDWITLVSWGFQKNFDSPKVSHSNGDTAYIRKYDTEWVERIKRIRSKGFKVFLKPHLWIHNEEDGKWRSDIFHNSEKDWEQWKATYRSFILRYARVAERANAEMFCIGIEFTRLALEKPEFWRTLIKEVRGIYSGKLTYGANWYEEYEKITFWKDLDYIGIQAYFPLSKNESPSVADVSKGWGKYIPTLKEVSKNNKRQVVFTEMGYKSTPDSAIEPWIWVEDPRNEDNLYSPETQANCYTAFFNKVWDQDWFAGVHLWQMRPNHESYGPRIKIDFTPQGKPAQEIIAQHFK